MSRHRKRITPMKEAEGMIGIDKDKDCIEKKFINKYIGHGIFATKQIVQGEFVAEYCGDLISVDATESIDDHTYLFIFSIAGLHYCIDGRNNNRMGRFFNDAPVREANCITKAVFLCGKPRILIFAAKAIEKGTELRYDYGLKHLPWREIEHSRQLGGGNGPREDQLEHSCLATSDETEQFEHSSQQLGGIDGPQKQQLDYSCLATSDETERFEHSSQLGGGYGLQKKHVEHSCIATSDETEQFEHSSQQLGGVDGPQKQQLEHSFLATSDETERFVLSSQLGGGYGLQKEHVEHSCIATSDETEQFEHSSQQLGGGDGPQKQQLEHSCIATSDETEQFEHSSQQLGGGDGPQKQQLEHSCIATSDETKQFGGVDAVSSNCEQKKTETDQRKKQTDSEEGGIDDAISSKCQRKKARKQSHSEGGSIDDAVASIKQRKKHRKHAREQSDCQQLSGGNGPQKQQLEHSLLARSDGTEHFGGVDAVSLKCEQKKTETEQRKKQTDSEEGGIDDAVSSKCQRKKARKQSHSEGGSIDDAVASIKQRKKHRKHAREQSDCQQLGGGNGPQKQQLEHSLLATSDGTEHFGGVDAVSSKCEQKKTETEQRKKQTDSEEGGIDDAVSSKCQRKKARKQSHSEGGSIDDAVASIKQRKKHRKHAREQSDCQQLSGGNGPQKQQLEHSLLARSDGTEHFGGVDAVSLKCEQKKTETEQRKKQTDSEEGGIDDAVSSKCQRKKARKQSHSEGGSIDDAVASIKQRKKHRKHAREQSDCQQLGGGNGPQKQQLEHSLLATSDGTEHFGGVDAVSSKCEQKKTETEQRKKQTDSEEGGIDDAVSSKCQRKKARKQSHSDGGSIDDAVLSKNQRKKPRNQHAREQYHIAQGSLQALDESVGKVTVQLGGGSGLQKEHLALATRDETETDWFDCNFVDNSCDSNGLIELFPNLGGIQTGKQFKKYAKGICYFSESDNDNFEPAVLSKEVRNKACKQQTRSHLDSNEGGVDAVPSKCEQKKTETEQRKKQTDSEEGGIDDAVSSKCQRKKARKQSHSDGGSIDDAVLSKNQRKKPRNQHAREQYHIAQGSLQALDKSVGKVTVQLGGGSGLQKEHLALATRDETETDWFDCNFVDNSCDSNGLIELFPNLGGIQTGKQFKKYAKGICYFSESDNDNFEPAVLSKEVRNKACKQQTRSQLDSNEGGVDAVPSKCEQKKTETEQRKKQTDSEEGGIDDAVSSKCQRKKARKQSHSEGGSIDDAVASINQRKKPRKQHAREQSDLDQGSLLDFDESVGKVTVPSANNSKCKRVWDKRHYCKFCSKGFAKLPRHFEDMHEHEAEVVAFLAHPPKSPRRVLMLRKLTNDGDYNHNFLVLSRNEGEIVTYRRPSAEENVQVNRYVPCEFCLAMFVRDDIWKHLKTCKLRGAVDNRPGRTQNRCALLLPISKEASDGLKKNVISKMNNDDIANAIRGDCLIMQYGSRLYSKNGRYEHRHQYISQKIRELGRLRLALDEVSGRPVRFKDCIHPFKFNTVLSAMRIVCGFDADKQSFKIPSLALKIGHALNACAEIVQTESITSGDKQREEEASKFMALCRSQWKFEVSTHALSDLSERKFNKPQVLPLTEDLVLLHNQLKQQSRSCSQRLTQSANVAAWIKLCNIVLCQTVLFNRRRGGETQRITLQQFSYCAKAVAMDSVIKESLSELEKQLCCTTWRLEIQGKCGRKVPVLFNEEVKKNIDVLISTREDVGVPKNNVFVFARINASTHIRSSDALRHLAQECGAQSPASITTTRLRKHVGTVSQLLNLKDNELDMLADYMGHSIKVHREFYRLPMDTLQVAKVSRILLAMEKGAVNFQGKTLDEIQIDLNDVESDSSESDMDNEDNETEGSETEIDDDIVTSTSVGYSSHKTLEEPQDGSVDTAVLSNVLEENARMQLDEVGLSSCVRKKPSETSAPVKKKASVPRRPWTQAESTAVLQSMRHFVQLQRVPNKTDCERCIANSNGVLSDRDWSGVKFFVANQIQKVKKQTKGQKV